MDGPVPVHIGPHPLPCVADADGERLNETGLEVPPSGDGRVRVSD